MSCALAMGRERGQHPGVFPYRSAFISGWPISGRFLSAFLPGASELLMPVPGLPLDVEGQGDKNTQKSHSGAGPIPLAELFTQLGSAFGWLAPPLLSLPPQLRALSAASSMPPPPCPESRGLCSRLCLDSMRPGEAIAFRTYLEVNKSRVAALCLHYKPCFLPPSLPPPPSPFSLSDGARSQDSVAVLRLESAEKSACLGPVGRGGLPAGELDPFLCWLGCGSWSCCHSWPVLPSERQPGFP